MAGFEENQWQDIIRIPQDDGPHPVVKINYAQEFITLMDIFRGVLAVGEYSERVLVLTSELLQLNPGSYTVWQYRRACLKALNSDLNAELDYMDSFADDNPKNYQIWQHRRVIVEALGNGQREKEFCEKIFEEDAKNYHAWAHRQWAVKSFQLWDGELEFVDQCIDDDVRNNSAWNHRWFVIHENPAGISDEVIEREIKYTTDHISLVTKNESAWNYLRGLANKHPQILSKLCEWLVSFLSSNLDHEKNYFAVGLLADLRDKEGTVESLTHARELFKQLIDVDPMRIKSWTRRLHLVSLKLENFP